MVFALVAAFILPRISWAVTYSRPTFNWLIPLVDILVYIMLFVTVILGITSLIVRYYHAQPQTNSAPTSPSPTPVHPRITMIAKLFRISLFVMLGLIILYFILHFIPINTDVVAVSHSPR